MIGKQTKGTSFGGCVRYVLKEEKSKLLEAVGVDGSPEQAARRAGRRAAQGIKPASPRIGCSQRKGALPYAETGRKTRSPAP